MRFWLGVVFLLILNYCSLIRGEVFTAIDDMAGLVNAEEEVLSYLKSYITVQEDRLNGLKR